MMYLKYIQLVPPAAQSLLYRTRESEREHNERAMGFKGARAGRRETSHT